MTSRQHGFTLLEVIVVLVIFGVLSLMAYGGLASVLRTRDKVEQSMERTADLQRAYLRLRRDFEQVRLRPARDSFGEAQAALLVTSDGDVELTRGGWRNPMGQKRSTMERVAYRFDDNKLIRRSWLVLDRAPQSEPVETVVADKVEQVEWRFLNASREWQSTWPAEQTGMAQPDAVPPVAVELVLHTEDWSELRFLFRIVAVGKEPQT